MGDAIVEQIVNATVNATAQNATDELTNAKIPATPEGAAVAYGSLIVMAMLPIFFGALRSVKHQKDQKVSSPFLIQLDSLQVRMLTNFFSLFQNVCRGIIVGVCVTWFTIELDHVHTHT